MAAKRKKHSHYILIYLEATCSTKLTLINSNKVIFSYLYTTKIHKHILSHHFAMEMCHAKAVESLS